MATPETPYINVDGLTEWVPWEGGTEPPLIDGLRCDMLRRNGDIDLCENYQDWLDEWCWGQGRPDADDDIVAYRGPTWE